MNIKRLMKIKDADRNAFKRGVKVNATLPNNRSVSGTYVEPYAPDKHTIKGDDGADGKDGRDGRDGKNAYEIALENGFVGTEAEWLQSLKGQDGAPAEVDTSKFIQKEEKHCYLNYSNYANTKMDLQKIFLKASLVRKALVHLPRLEDGLDFV